MKQKTFALCMVTLLIISCNLPSLVTSTPPIETAIVIATNTTDSGGVVTLNNVSFTIPLGVAKDAKSETVSAVTDTNNSPRWEVAPEHLKFTLTSYQLQDIPAAGGPDNAYYDAVAKALDSQYPDSFNPSLFQLDALIQSITVTP